MAEDQVEEVEQETEALQRLPSVAISELPQSKVSIGGERSSKTSKRESGEKLRTGSEATPSDQQIATVDQVEVPKKKGEKKKEKTGDAPEKKKKEKPEKKGKPDKKKEEKLPESKKASIESKIASIKSKKASIKSKKASIESKTSKKASAAGSELNLDKSRLSVGGDTKQEEVVADVPKKAEKKAKKEKGGKVKKKKDGSIDDEEAMRRQKVSDTAGRKSSVSFKERTSAKLTAELASEDKKLKKRKKGGKKHASADASLASEDRSLVISTGEPSITSIERAARDSKGKELSVSDFEYLRRMWAKEREHTPSSSSGEVTLKKGKKKEKKAKADADTLDSEKKKGVKQTASATGPGEEIAEKKPKKKKKKEKKEKLTEKEKARREQERKLLAEQEAIRLEEEERLRLIEEKKRLTAKAKQEIIDQGHRVDQLAESMELINVIKQAGWDAYAIDKERIEWEDYLTCDGLPKPTNVPQMNTYLHLWEKVKEWQSSEETNHRTDEIVKLLERLQAAIDDPFDAPQSQQVDWKWIRKMFREYQKDSLDFCTYRILRGIDNNMKRIDLQTAEFRLKGDNMALCLWALIQLPIPAPNPRETIKNKIHLLWPEFSMQVLFPSNFKCDTCAVRGMYLKYDYLSDTSALYDPHGPSPYFSTTLDVHTAKEWYTKTRYNYENRTITPKPPVTVELDDGTTVEVPGSPEPEVVEGMLPPYVPYQKLTPTSSEYALQLEAKLYEEEKKNLKLDLPPYIINLRKYAILGGVYYLDLFYQPFQPQGMVSYEVFITSLQIPCLIKEAPFESDYKDPLLIDENKRASLSPEEIAEEEMQILRELEKLILIELEPPKFVFWFYPPIVCHWDGKYKFWHTKDVIDYKYDDGTSANKKVHRTATKDVLNYEVPVEEEKKKLTFRTGRFGPFALVANRWANLPFKYWEMAPDDDGTVRVKLECAILTLDFHVKHHLVCITAIENAPGDCMEHNINVYYKLPRLIRIMRECGVDIFPCFDTTHYVEGNPESPTNEKHFTMERHLYYNMAHVATIYNMAWSRWNRTVDYLAAVFRFKLVKRTKRTLPWSTCLVTHLKATIVETTEESETFNDTPIEGTRFNADFHILMRNFSSMGIKKEMAEMPQDTVNTLANLLIQTRILSFS